MASAINSWSALTPDPAPLELASRSYQPRLKLGSGQHFNGQSDDFVTRPGYRLWIDEQDRLWEKPSPFMGFSDRGRYLGVGLRDGMRYQSLTGPPYLWNFTRPRLDTTEPIWKICAEFDFDDGTRLTQQTQSFQSWLLRNDMLGERAQNWQPDPTQTVYTAFLHAKHQTDNALKPVIEMKWDASRPDEVGFDSLIRPLTIASNAGDFGYKMVLSNSGVSCISVITGSKQMNLWMVVALNQRTQWSSCRYRKARAKTFISNGRPMKLCPCKSSSNSRKHMPV